MTGLRYSQNQKTSAIELYKTGLTLAEVSAKTGCHRSSIYRWVVNIGLIRSVSEASKGKVLSQTCKDKISAKLKGAYTGEARYNYKQLQAGYDTPTPELA